MGGGWTRIQKPRHAVRTALHTTHPRLGRKKKRHLPQPKFLNLHAVIAELQDAPRDANGFPKDLNTLERRILNALRDDIAAWLPSLFERLAKRAWPKARGNAPHSRRSTLILTLFGWLRVAEPYRPNQPSALRAALGVEHKTTPAARDAIARCGALGGSFNEARDSLAQLAGLETNTSKVRSITLAEGQKAYEKAQKPLPDIRAYQNAPHGAVMKVPLTLVCMTDGGGAPCCKADTQGVAGKNGEAGTRQIRVAFFGEYEWLDKDGHPVFHEDSASYFVCYGDIAEFTGQLKLQGVSRGSGTAPRMHGMADGEPALEAALRDAFPHAVFTNDFYHAAEHLHACVCALVSDAADADREYRFCKGLLYRHGAASVIKRIRGHYGARLATSPEARGQLEYLEKRQANMCYGRLRAEGYHIGTGHIEAAIRVLLVRRCKQAGMHWRHINAAHMAALHAMYRSQAVRNLPKAA